MPKPFRRELPSHSVRTAAQMGWEDLRNGLLLAAAATAFDAMVTVDKKVKRQQNLAAVPIAVVVVNSVRCTPDALRPFGPIVDRVLPTLRVGQMVEVDAAGNVTLIAPGR